MIRTSLLVAVVACSDERVAPRDPRNDPVHRLDRACISGVLAGEITTASLGDELFVVHGCDVHRAEGLILQKAEFVDFLSCCELVTNVELVGLRDGVPMAIQENRSKLTRYLPNAPTTAFAHMFDDAAFLDINGNDVVDYVTVADGAVRRAPEKERFQAYVEPTTEITLLAGKSFHFAAFVDFGGSPLPDIFYATNDGELGLAMQTSPDVFAALALASDPGTPQRLSIGDVDGDGLPDVVGATGHLFVYSSKRHAVALLDEGAQAIGIGDLDGDGRLEAIYITVDRSQVRRLVIADDGTLSSKPVIEDGGDAIAIGDIDGDLLADVALVHDLGAPTSWIDLWRGYYLP